MENAQRINPREFRKEKQTDLVAEPLPSITAGVSWMFGIVSIPLLLVPPSAIVTALIAIVFGHVSKSRMRNSAGVSGESTATGGLLMGYLCLLAGLALLPSIRMQSTLTRGMFASFYGVTAASSGTPFEIAERSLLSGSAPATGNTEDARKLSSQLSAELNEKRDEFFLGRNPLPIQTLCQISDQGLCVVAVIPDIAEFDELARVAMLNLVWQRSQALSFGMVEPGVDVAVAVRDRLRYHSMEFGRATLSPEKIAQPDSAFIDVSVLELFFENDVQEDPVEPSEVDDEESQ